jgi:allantoicase
MPEFTHLIDLASARLGGETVAANDEFFAGRENLLKPEPPVFINDKYTDRGKWMDGWETRRRRSPGHDWCIVKLGLPGIVHAVVVDTAFFTGNYPSHCSIDACGLPPGGDPTSDSIVWRPLLGRVELAGDTKNAFQLQVSRPAERRVTHVRLNIFPDGGVARLRVLGEVLPDWMRLLGREEDIDLAAVVNGAYVVDTSDRFYGEPHNMLMPYAAANMGDGWETKRRRGPGHDWSIIRLGVTGLIHQVHLDTAFFKGNYPDSASLEAALIDDDTGGISADVSTRAIADWKVVLPQTKLEADHLHTFASEVTPQTGASHIRLNIHPDGGVSRFRVFGSPLPQARRAAVLRQVNALDEQEVTWALADFFAAPEWLSHMAAARPFGSAREMLASAEGAADLVGPEGWREAFRHHPRIGERQAERTQSPAAQDLSAREQEGMAHASADDRSALLEGNRVYQDRFGYVFIICATGRTAGEMLALLRERLSNDPETELRVAAGEQRKITRLRLERLLG